MYAYDAPRLLLSVRKVRWKATLTVGATLLVRLVVAYK